MNTRVSIVSLAVLIVSFLSACSSNKPVPSYDGDFPADQQAVLEVPASINLLKVNGKRMKDYLLEDLAVKYALKPGANVLEFEYATLWASSGVGDEKRSETVKSESKTLVVEAKAGTVYKLDVPLAENLREAKEIAADLQASVIDKNLNIVSEVYVPEPEPVPIAVATDAPGALSEMQSLWRSLSPEQKQQFLKWALQ